MNLPDIVSRDEWLVARKALLTEEKELTKRRERSTPGVASCRWSW